MPRRPQDLPLLAGKAVAAVCVGYFALWACAPMTSGPPPVPLAEEAPNALGGAVHGAAVFGDPGLLDTMVEAGPAGLGAGLDLWYQRRLGARFHLGGLLSAGTASAASGGVQLRYRLNDPAAATSVGLSLSGGFLWAQLGVPVSVPLSERLALYTQPAVGLSALGLERLPVGLSWQTGQTGRMHWEIGAWGPITGGIFKLEAAQMAPVLYTGLGWSGAF